MTCKSGYKTEPADCSGEQFLHVSPTQYLTVPINTEVAPEDMNPTQFTVEIWLKSDNIGSFVNEIFLGLSPYKFRKKASLPNIHIVYFEYSYCDSPTLKTDQWYHFAFSLSEEGSGSIACYLDG
jgi:hypothetical protein